MNEIHENTDLHEYPRSLSFLQAFGLGEGTAVRTAVCKNNGRNGVLAADVDFLALSERVLRVFL